MIKKIFLTSIILLFILSAYVLYQISQPLVEIPFNKAESDIASLSIAIDLYKIDNGIYPSTEQGLEALILYPTTGTIPKKLV